MTHPLIPREKVDLKPCPFCGGEVFADQEKTSFIIGCFRTKCGMEPYCTGDDLNEVANQWNRRATLASGSGDHAELAKRLRSSKRERHGIYGRVLVNPDGPEAADTIEALLAENAALRAERDEWRNTVRFNERCWSEERGVLIDRATEAERKLAEIVSSANQFGIVLKGEIRAILSKEAERG